MDCLLATEFKWGFHMATETGTSPSFNIRIDPKWNNHNEPHFQHCDRRGTAFGLSPGTADWLLLVSTLEQRTGRIWCHPRNDTLTTLFLTPEPRTGRIWSHPWNRGLIAFGLTPETADCPHLVSPLEPRTGRIWSPRFLPPHLVSVSPGDPTRSSFII